MNTDRILPAIAMRLTSVFVFASMNVCIKLAERGGASVSEILFFRQFGASLLVAAVIAAGPGLRSVATTRLPAHVLTTIGFTVPIFATILGALVLREPTGWHRWAAVATGFAGVLIVAQPSGSHFPLWGAGCALAGAFGTATVTILLRRIGRTESALTTVFWFSTLSVLPLSLLYAGAAQPHSFATWCCLAGVGGLGGIAQIAMTSSLRLGPVSVVVPMDYSSLLWATLFGWLVFDVLPASATWLGAPVIVASGLYIVWREHRRRQILTEEATAASG